MNLSSLLDYTIYILMTFKCIFPAQNFFPNLTHIKHNTVKTQFLLFPPQSISLQSYHFSQQQLYPSSSSSQNTGVILCPFPLLTPNLSGSPTVSALKKTDHFSHHLYWYSLWSKSPSFLF